MINMKDKSFEDGIKSMFKNNFGLEEQESILILTDYPTEKELADLSEDKIYDMIDRIFLAKYIYQIAENLDYNISIKIFPSTGQSGKEIPEDAAKLMTENDIFIAITTFSLSHTEARKKATEEHGARGASCPGITRKMFDSDGPMLADYNQIKKDTDALVEKLNNSKRGKILAPNGTEVYFFINPNSAEPDTGIIKNKGDFSNLPAGEAYLAPIEERTTGRLIVSKGWYEDLEEDMTIEIDNGLVYQITGGGVIGEKFNDLLFNEDKYNEATRLSRRNIAEVGIGTNPKAKDPQNVLEAEKIKGTCHIAIGDNHTFGGTVESDIHVDFVIPKAQLFLDKKEINLTG
ncbi:MAG: hypothetical protein EU549_03030 [Promethearchaeota archaeon]|nr:MAG: hypothetical protein EU549_03030 [Candidatus Lokiarchaeota archaeon]